MFLSVKVYFCAIGQSGEISTITDAVFALSDINSNDLPFKSSSLKSNSVASSRSWFGTANPVKISNSAIRGIDAEWVIFNEFVAESTNLSSQCQKIHDTYHRRNYAVNYFST